MTQANGSFKPARVVEHLLEPLLEMAAVVEPSQRVGLRHVAQPLVGLEQLALALLELLLQPLDAEHRIDARFELGEVDRLGDVVVGARLESFDLDSRSSSSAVCMMIGMNGRDGFPLTRRATSMPSICGIMTSSRIRSGGDSSIFANASAPSPAVCVR